MKTVVMGIGNILLSDEGVGVYVMEQVRSAIPSAAGIEYIDGGTLSFTLAADLEGADNLIVIDAAALDEHPGAVACMVGEEMDTFLGQCRCSAHEVGLIDLLDIARLTTGVPENRALVAIQPEKIDWGERPGAIVLETIPEAVAHVTHLIGQWHKDEMLECGQRHHA